jgi:hypothetical protein
MASGACRCFPSSELLALPSTSLPLSVRLQFSCGHGGCVPEYSSLFGELHYYGWTLAADTLFPQLGETHGTPHVVPPCARSLGLFVLFLESPGSFYPYSLQ